MSVVGSSGFSGREERGSLVEADKIARMRADKLRVEFSGREERGSLVEADKIAHRTPGVGFFRRGGFLLLRLLYDGV